MVICGKQCVELQHHVSRNNQILTEVNFLIERLSLVEKGVAHELKEDIQN
jgi:hypothetical protein